MNFQERWLLMNKRICYHFILQFLILVAVLALTLSNSEYYPLNALKSMQITNNFIQANNGVATESEINSLRKSVILSPGNCRARDALGKALFSVAFNFGIQEKVINENSFTTRSEYSVIIPADKGENQVYDKDLAEEMFNAWEVVKKECSPYLLNAHFYKGYSYYLIGKPLLAIQEMEDYLGLDTQDTNTGGMLNNPVNAYDIISKSYADLQDSKNAAMTLAISLSQQGESDSLTEYNIPEIGYYGSGNATEYITEYGAKVDQINQYLDEAQISIVPSRLFGFGRYSTMVVRRKDQFVLFGVNDDDPSGLNTLVSLQIQDGNLISNQVMNVTDYQLGSICLDKNGNIHVAYSFGDEYVMYANSKDDFSHRTSINRHSAILLSLNPQEKAPAINSIQITCDDQGRSHLIWSYGLGVIEYTTIENGAPNLPEIIASNAFSPDIKVFANSKVGVIYNDSTTFPDQETQVWYMEQDNGVWENPVQISRSGMWAGAASILSDEKGVLHVFYVTGASPEDVTLMHVIRNSQGNWQEPESIGSKNYRPLIPTASQGKPISFGGRTAPSIALLSGNRVVVVWRGPFINGQTEVLGREYINGKWQTVQVLGGIAGQEYTDTPSVVLQNEDPDTVNLIWLSDEQINFYDWTP